MCRVLNITTPFPFGNFVRYFQEYSRVVQDAIQASIQSHHDGPEIEAVTPGLYNYITGL